MSRSQELSEFKRGTVIGCHLCNKSIRKISSLLNIPLSTVSVNNWEQQQLSHLLGQSKMTERDQNMLNCTVRRSCQLTA
ncbi:unnamed protein product, partial [Staurois parvus]